MKSVASPDAVPAAPPSAPSPGAALAATTLVLFLATVVVGFGGPWDLSWHMTVGRDRFWTAPHVAIYLGATTAGLLGGWLAIRATWLRRSERAGTVGIWGGFAPLGAWVSIWGALTMLTAGGFDDWWHNAYGLDVKLVSPPHILLFTGVICTRIGTGLIVLRDQNRRPDDRRLAWMVCGIGALCLAATTQVLIFNLWPNRQHSFAYFLLAAGVYPVQLAVISRVCRLRWGVTWAALGYMGFVCSLLWILPRFPAEPHLGPIYNHVTHLVPPPWPQWLILPAFALDLLRPWFERSRSWRADLACAAAVAVVFVAVFLPVQWRFSTFYLTAAADNAFFVGNRIWAYSTPLAGQQYFFWDGEGGWAPFSIACTGALAWVMAWLGLRAGSWMARLQR